MTERHLSPKDIMAALSISLSSAYKVIRQMPRRKFGRNVRVSETDFQAWLQQNTLEPSTHRERGASAGRERSATSPRTWKEVLAREAAEGRPRLIPKVPKIGVPRRQAVDDAPDRPRIKPTRPRD